MACGLLKPLLYSFPKYRLVHSATVEQEKEIIVWFLFFSYGVDMFDLMERLNRRRSGEGVSSVDGDFSLSVEQALEILVPVLGGPYDCVVRNFAALVVFKKYKSVGEVIKSIDSPIRDIDLRAYLYVKVALGGLTYVDIGDDVFKYLSVKQELEVLNDLLPADYDPVARDNQIFTLFQSFLFIEGSFKKITPRILDIDLRAYLYVVNRLEQQNNV